MSIPYKDLHSENEDERIRQIGEKCMNEKQVVGFMVDNDLVDMGKADRYIQKLLERYPGIRVQFRGPFATGITLVKVAPPEK